jgi:hypothetical protein
LCHLLAQGDTDLAPARQTWRDEFSLVHRNRRRNANHAPDSRRAVKPRSSSAPGASRAFRAATTPPRAAGRARRHRRRRSCGPAPASSPPATSPDDLSGCSASSFALADAAAVPSRKANGPRPQTRAEMVGRLEGGTRNRRNPKKSLRTKSLALSVWWGGGGRQSPLLLDPSGGLPAPVPLFGLLRPTVEKWKVRSGEGIPAIRIGGSAPRGGTFRCGCAERL